MSVYATAFEIPPGSTLPRTHLERQAITRLVHMIPPNVTITHAAVRDLAAFVREDVADMAAWIDYTTRSAA